MNTLPELELDWRADIDNHHNVTLDDAKFVFYQAEKRLDDTIKNFDATTTKAVTFISFATTLLTALTAYLFINFDPKGQFDPKLMTTFLGASWTGFVLYNFVRLILPKEYHAVGSAPQDLYVNGMFADSVVAKSIDSLRYPTLCLYLNEIESYNSRIAKNEALNLMRLAGFNIAAQRLCLMPVLAFACYMLITLLLAVL